jgi:hypothetical protein
MTAQGNTVELTTGTRARNGADWSDGRAADIDDPVLDTLGIDHETLTVYRLFRLHGNQPLEWLAGKAGLPADRAREAVRKLADLTLIRPSWDRPGEMFAVDPELGFSLLITRAQDDLAQRRTRLQDCRSLIATVISEYELNVRQDRHDEIETLLGLDEIRSRLEALAEECRQETLCLQPYPALPGESMDAARPLNSKALRRGVTFRSVYLDRIVKDDASLAYVNGIVRQGGEIRTTPSVPLRMIIVDRRVALVGKDAGDARSATVLRDPGVLQALAPGRSATREHGGRTG